MKLIQNYEWDNSPVPMGSISSNITPRNGGVAIHYVGGPGVLTPSSHLKCASIVRSIKNQHVNDNGWDYIAYSLLVCVHGTIFEGRGVGKRTAANGSSNGNQNYYAICGLVNTNDKITPELLRGISEGVAYLRQYGSAGKSIVGHKDLYNTDCPGPLTRYVRAGTFGGLAPVNNSYPGRLIRRGSTGSTVKKVQKRLIVLKFSVGKFGADGIFGKDTEAAVKKFQKANKLVADGIVGPKTWAKLF